MKKLILFNVFVSLAIFTGVASAQNVGETTFHFQDASRNRPVITEVWYPTADAITQSTSNNYPFIHTPSVRNGKIKKGIFPLILISHGTGGGRMTLEWLADKLVANGFIVAAVDHYGNTYDNKIAVDFVEPWQRPLDISYALTSLLKDSTFGKHINEKRIGAAGFSIGGYTVIALAGAKLNLGALESYFNTLGGRKEAAIPEFPNVMSHVDSGEVIRSFKNSPPLKDRRIRAFFAICPAIGQGFTSKQQFTELKSPLYIVGAQSDSMAPVKTNAMHYHELIENSKLTIVPGKVGHYVFLNEAIEEIKKQQPFIFADDPSVDRRQVHEQVSQLAVDFFKNSLK